MLMVSRSGIVVPRANRGISAMSGQRGLSLRVWLRQSRKYLFVIGVTLSMVSLVVVCRENKEVRSAYCLVSVTLLLLTEALPTQVTAMLPLFLYMGLDFFGDVNIYVPGSVLHLVAVLLAMASTDSSTLTAHATFYVLSVTGTRLRNLLFACLALGCFLSLLLEETLAVLLIARIICKVVEVLQQESVQVLHQRELFRKTVTRMPALKGRPDLRDSLLKNVAESVLDSPQSTDRELSASRVPASLLQSPEKPSTSLGQRDSTVDIDRSQSLPVSNEISDLSAAIMPVDSQAKHKEPSMWTDSICLASEDSSPESATAHSEGTRKEDVSTDGDMPESRSTVPAFSSKLSRSEGAAISLGKRAGAAYEDHKPSDKEKPFSNQTVTEASVCSSIEKLFNDDSSLGTRDSQGTSSQHTEEPKADERRKVIWKRVLGRMGHSAAGVFPPLRSLMEKSMIPESSPAVPMLCDGVVAEGTAMSTSALTPGGALKSALLSPSRNRKLKKTTLLEDGKVFYPGESTPPRKHGHGKKRKLAVPEEDRQEVREIYFWKKERYHTIHRKLLLGVVIMCALASMLNRTSNGGNVELYLYFERNFGEDSIISEKSWWLLILPVEVIACLIHWQFMRITFLRHFDAPQTLSTRAAIKLSIEKWKNDLGMIRVADVAPALLIGVWLTVYIALASGIIQITESYEKLEVDFIVIVALFSLPWSWGSKPPTAGVRFIVQKLPWGAVLTYGTTFTLYFVVKNSRFSTWLKDHLINLQGHNKLLSQATLAICAAVMTELLSSRHTVRILLPVATEAALVRPCNPLYYALPITVAASTSMVFPTARITIALLSELTDMGPLSMLLYGILLKAVIVICALISVDTLGQQVFNWSTLPAWMLSHHLNASGDWFVSSRQFSTTPYIQHFGASAV